jgi:hypothetical protein
MFLYPIFFWAMLGLVPLVAVYFLKVRPRRKYTTAFFLWQTVLSQKRAMSLWRRLRDMLSLLLMILAFLTVVLALCAPQWSSDQGHDLLIVIDNSASMSTQYRNDTRLAQAKRVAKGMIRNLGPNQQAAVASVSLDLAMHSHFTTSPRSLLEAVDQIEPSVCRLQSDAVIGLASQTVGDRPVRLVLLSDGCGVTESLPETVELFKISSVQDNIGLVACDLQTVPGPGQTASLYFQLASSADHVIPAEVWVQGPGQVTRKLIPVEVSPGINAPEVYALDQAESGTWTLRLDKQDALSLDNQACLMLPDKQPIRVAVNAQEGFFLQHSVMAFAQTGGDLLLVDSSPDLVLSQGQMADTQRGLLFGPDPGEAWWGTMGELVDDVVAHEVIKGHPVLEHCDLGAVPFVGAREVRLPKDALVLLENSRGVPLLYRVRDGDRCAVVVNMDLKGSDFHYSAWFPVLVYNAARHVMGHQATEVASYSTGSVLDLPDARGTIQVKRPGHEEYESVTSDTFGPLSLLGFYHFNHEHGAWSVGTGLYAPAETLVNSEVSDTSRPISRGWAPSVWLCVLALLVLLTECSLYHRRKVG